MDLVAFEAYIATAREALEAVDDLKALAAWHQSHLARAGELTAWKKGIGQVPAEQRKDFGRAINVAAGELQALFDARREQIKLDEMAELIRAERLDVTLPAASGHRGRYHPLTQAKREIVRIFSGMGFSVYESPHVELDDICFQQLNIPKDHPARDMQDTFFISDEVVLRPHTSSGQIRAMREMAPAPLQVILPGLCFRYEEVTSRSEIQFHQVEGLLVGEHVSFSDLKGILLRFAQIFFGPDQAIRLRGSYFPFTEPSVEVDIKCTLCDGEGCRICKHTGWLELLGAGLVHPTVLKNGGYNPDKVQGIAFGMGVERIVLLKHQIQDIRYFFQNDLRFLQQFD